MKKGSAISFVTALIVLTLIGTGAILVDGSEPVRRRPGPGFTSNEAFIDGLYTNLNLVKSKEVFRHVFRALPEEVTVYPSENYYYFKTTIRGKTISGALWLSAKRIDSGLIGLGFTEKVEHRDRVDSVLRRGLANDFGARDSVMVSRVNDFRYTVTFEGKKVAFNFHDIGLTPPKSARLMEDEVYVGPSFDESGLRFFLVFNRSASRLFWVLNEDGFVPESFTPHSSRVVVGDRTEYLFYLDTANNRKILVGVHAHNIRRNNWYDGPFDQMPDNYVKSGRIELKKYLLAHFGYPEKKIDRYGYMRKGARVLVAPYRIYDTPDDLDFVDSCAVLDMPTPEFYRAITEHISSTER